MPIISIGKMGDVVATVAAAAVGGQHAFVAHSRGTGAVTLGGTAVSTAADIAVMEGGSGTMIVFGDAFVIDTDAVPAEGGGEGINAGTGGSGARFNVNITPQCVPHRKAGVISPPEDRFLSESTANCARE